MSNEILGNDASPGAETEGARSLRIKNALDTYMRTASIVHSEFADGVSVKATNNQLVIELPKRKPVERP